MAVDFGVLQTANPVSAFFKGQQDVAQNMLAQQKMAQEQEMNALRRQQAQVGMQQARTEMAGAEEDRARKRRAERVGLFRERLLRAATPEAAREIVKMQYADPDLAPVLSQAGTLEQALAEVPDDPVQFQTYRQQEAMGMGEWMKSQLPKVTPLGVFDPATRQYIMPPPKPEKTVKPTEVALLESLGLEPTLENLARLKQAQTAPAQPTQDPIIRQYEYAKQQGFTGSLFDFKRQLTEAGRPPAQPRAEPAPRTKEVTLNDGTLGIMNMDTGAITRATVSGVPAKGKSSAFAEKAAAQRVQLEKDLTTAISELKNAVKPGGLIDQSTGSGAGRLVDVGARFVGKAMPGDIAIGKLAPISDLVLKMVPRFEGPQSDKDTQSYKEAAGQLADATLPREIRRQAAITIVRLMENRKGQFRTKEMDAEGAGASSVPAPPPGFTPDNQ